MPVNCWHFAQKLTTILGRVSAWLGREGSNLRMAESKSAALPLGYAPTGRSGDGRRPADVRLRRSIGQKGLGHKALIQDVREVIFIDPGPDPGCSAGPL